jgi:hypothetical protein
MKRSLHARQRELQWRERVAGQSNSGQSISAWCREQGIAVQSFYWWRARLAKAEPGKPSQQADHAASFIDLGTLGQTGQAGGLCAGTLEIRLDLGSGMVLTIARR